MARKRLYVTALKLLLVLQMPDSITVYCDSSSFPSGPQAPYGQCICQRRKLPAYLDTQGSISLTPLVHNCLVSLWSAPKVKVDEWKEDAEPLMRVICPENVHLCACFVDRQFPASGSQKRVKTDVKSFNVLTNNNT